MKIAIIGAGSIGLYIGCRLQQIGAEVVFVGRDRFYQKIKDQDLKISDYKNDHFKIPFSEINYHLDYEHLDGVDVAFIAVKNQASRDVAKELSKFLSKNSIIYTLQNGLNNKEVFQKELEGYRVYDGLVGFNVVIK